MNLESILQRLQLMPSTVAAIVHGLSDDDLRWPPEDGNWTIIEVLCHLADEEVEDFRTRLRMTLDRNNESWPPINPPQAAIDRDYRSQPVADVLARFTAERAASVEWLRTLTNADWSLAYQHPQFGPIRAGDLLASWAAHDALHLRQIARRLFQLAQRDASAFSTGYAGEWRA